jgi:hypothetical protein
MWNRWKASFGRDNYNYLIHPYVTGEWFDGWTQENSPSVNTKESPPIRHIENLQKAGLTIEFLILLNHAEEDKYIKHYLKEFKKLVISVQKLKNRPLTSDYPFSLGFYFPSDSAHFRSVYYKDWVQLMHDNLEFNRGSYISWAAGMTKTSDFLQSILLNIDLSKINFKEDKITISPKKMGEKNKTCDIFLKENAIGKISFQHN